MILSLVNYEGGKKYIALLKRSKKDIPVNFVNAIWMTFFLLLAFGE